MKLFKVGQQLVALSNLPRGPKKGTISTVEGVLWDSVKIKGYFGYFDANAFDLSVDIVVLPNVKIAPVYYVDFVNKKFLKVVA